MDRTFDPALYAKFDDAWEAGMYEAKPCLDCGTTGGYIPPDCKTPGRTRGLCFHCYIAHKRHGTLDQFPLGADPGRIPQAHPQPVPTFVELTYQPMNWSALSTQEWHASIARDNARTWATAAWVGREAA